jgi:hypothetical protein
MSTEKRNDAAPDENSGNRSGAGNDQYKNIETSVNNPAYFDDDYESRAEDELTEEEPKTEKDGRTGKS